MSVSFRKRLTLAKVPFWLIVVWAAVVIFVFLCIQWSPAHLRRSNVVGEYNITGDNNRSHGRPYMKTITHGKFYFVFTDREQLSMATRNLLTLAALGSYSGHQVVVPFVKNSKFFGCSKMSSDTQTLELYYNLTAFNNKLRSHGYSTLVSWERFQNVCRNKLNLLLYINYGNKAFHRGKKTKCDGNQRHQGFVKGFRVLKTICVDSGMLSSVKDFLKDVINGNECVGIDEWRGNGTLTSYRVLFPLPSNIHRPLDYKSVSQFFNEKLLEIAQHFISKMLGSNYVSFHIRSEKILKRPNGTITTLVNCLKQLSAMTSRSREYRKISPPGGLIEDLGYDNHKIFVATDFSPSGSQSFGVSSARNNTTLLLNHLYELLDNPVFFQPHVYNLLDTGAVAIVEMTIVTSGRQLFLTGGGSFQGWIKDQFANGKQNGYGKVHVACTSK